MKKSISFYPDEKLRKLIEKEAKEERRSINQQILFILTKYFSNGGGAK